MIGEHPNLERIDTAIKSIWRMYKWGRWGWLEAIGVGRDAYERRFQEFDQEHITNADGVLQRPEHVMTFLQSIGPEIVDRAIFLIHMYWLVGGLPE
jgi:hypothetical protein